MDSPFCCICGEDAKTIVHVLRDCYKASVIWQQFIPLEFQNKFFSLQVHEWLSYNLVGNDIGKQVGNWHCRFAVVCWFLWRWRNDRLFSNQEWPDVVNMHRILEMEQQLNRASEQLKRLHVRRHYSCLQDQVMFNH